MCLLSTRVAKAPTIHVVNDSRLPDRDVTRMVAACHTQMRRDVAPAHWLAPSPVVARDNPPADGRVITITDRLTESALGWHTEAAGDRVLGVVGVEEVEEAGGGVLTGDLSVSSVLSHEVAEMMVNAHVSGWCDTGSGYLVAREVADPVQAHSYEIKGVAVSNFVNHDYFSPIHVEGDRYDHLGVLSEPFSLAPGGYYLRLAGGQVTPVHAERRSGPHEAYRRVKTRHSLARPARLTQGRPA